MMKPRQVPELIAAARDSLAACGIDTARLDAELLLGHALGCSRAELYLHWQRRVTPHELATFSTLLARRQQHEPIAYITGVREFWSIPIAVAPAVLIPRPETETVVEQVLKLNGVTASEVRILDLCTGSGCIAAALAKELVHARFTVLDLSPDALAVAQRNLASVAHRVEFLAGNLFEPLHGQESSFTIITANPPYMPDGYLKPRELTFEPDLAFRAGERGLDLIAKIIENAPWFLSPQGWLVMEIGAEQKRDVLEIAKQRGVYQAPIVTNDLAGIARVITLRTLDA